MQTLRGFTLIEVLVATTIIAILVSILYVSFGDARVNARNKAMTVELKEMQLALETYRSQHGTYPLPEPGCGTAPPGQLVARTSGSGSWCVRGYLNSNAAIEPILAPEYISALPLAGESANSNCVIEYRTGDDATWYKLTAINCLAEVDADSGISPDEPLARCAISCSTLGVCDPTSAAYYESFAVYSRGGECL